MWACPCAGSGSLSVVCSARHSRIARMPSGTRRNSARCARCGAGAGMRTTWRSPMLLRAGAPAPMPLRPPCRRRQLARLPWRLLLLVLLLRAKRLLWQLRHPQQPRRQRHMLPLQQRQRPQKPQARKLPAAGRRLQLLRRQPLRQHRGRSPLRLLRLHLHLHLRRHLHLLPWRHRRLRRTSRGGGRSGRTAVWTSRRRFCRRSECLGGLGVPEP